MYEVWYENEFLGYADSWEEAHDMVVDRYGLYDPDELFLEEVRDDPDEGDLEMGFDPYCGCYTDDC